MNTYTKGPWIAEYLNFSQMWHIKKGGSPPHNRIALSKANAKLISAAPEMLEALKAVLWGPCLDECRGYMNGGHHTKNCDLVRAAVAKAEGGRTMNEKLLKGVDELRDAVEKEDWITASELAESIYAYSMSRYSEVKRN